MMNLRKQITKKRKEKQSKVPMVQQCKKRYVSKASRVQCPTCCQQFAKRSLRRHIERFHIEIMDSVTRGNITCLDCNQKFSREKALRVHLSKHHSMTFKEEKFYFDDYHEFNAWKAAIEKKTDSQYYQWSGPSYINSKRRCQYSCNRTGYFKSRKTVAGRKSRSSGKMDRHCTSNIIVVEERGTLHVTYIATHYGHEDSRTNSRSKRSNNNSTAPMETRKRNVMEYVPRGSKGAVQDRIVAVLQRLINNVNECDSSQLLESFEKVVRGAEMTFDMLLTCLNFTANQKAGNSSSATEGEESATVRERLQNILDDLHANQLMFGSI